MKQADYQARLDAAKTQSQKLEVICEQISDVNAGLQTFVRAELDRLQKEILLIRSDVDRIRVTTANTIQGSVGNVEINLKVLVQRFDAYEKRVNILIHDVEAIKHDE